MKLRSPDDPDPEEAGARLEDVAAPEAVELAKGLGIGVTFDAPGAVKLRSPDDPDPEDAGARLEEEVLKVEIDTFDFETGRTVRSDAPGIDRTFCSTESAAPSTSVSTPYFSTKSLAYLI